MAKHIWVNESASAFHHSMLDKIILGNNITSLNRSGIVKLTGPIKHLFSLFEMIAATSCGIKVDFTLALFQGYNLVLFGKVEWQLPGQTTFVYLC